MEEKTLLEQKIKNLFKTLKINTIITIDKNTKHYQPLWKISKGDYPCISTVQHCHGVLYKGTAKTQSIDIKFYTVNSVIGLLVLYHLIDDAEASSFWKPNFWGKNSLVINSETVLDVHDIKNLCESNWLHSYEFLQYLNLMNQEQKFNIIQLKLEPQEAVAEIIKNLYDCEYAIELDDLGFYNREESKRKLRVLLNLENDFNF